MSILVVDLGWRSKSGQWPQCRVTDKKASTARDGNCCGGVGGGVDVDEMHCRAAGLSVAVGGLRREPALFH